MDSNSTMDAFPLREALPICATNARQWGLNRLLDNRAPEVVGRGVGSVTEWGVEGRTWEWIVGGEGDKRGYNRRSCEEGYRTRTNR